MQKKKKRMIVFFISWVPVDNPTTTSMQKHRIVIKCNKIME